MIRNALGELLRLHATERPDQIALAMDGHALTYAEMDVRSDSIAAGLATLGVHKGDRVAVLAPNRVELLELFFGIAKTGAAQVPLNAFLKGEFLRHQLAQSGASVLITDASGVTAVQPLMMDLPELKSIVTFDGISFGIDYETLLDSGSTPPDVIVTADDTMSILYTSGTTGLPKGCVASHGYYCRAGEVLGHALGIQSGDVAFSALPLFHAGGQLASVACPLVHGIPGHVLSSFSAREFLPQAKQAGATVAWGVGAMAAALLATPVSGSDRDHPMQRMLTAPLTLGQQQEFRDRFGIEPYVDLFGQTECFPLTATPLANPELRDPAGCGRPAYDLEIAVLDDNGRKVPEGEVGEMCMRPREPYVMFDGYYNRSDATIEAFAGLWYHTGDYGKVLPSGALAFVDRKKDAIRRRGENISSFELEAGINGHPSIIESAVHAVPSELGEDDIKACLVVSSEVDPQGLFDYFKANLPYFAIPRYVEVMAELPRNGVQRVMKHKLREAGNGPETWDFEALGLTVDRAARR